MYSMHSTRLGFILRNLVNIEFSHPVYRSSMPKVFTIMRIILLSFFIKNN